MDFTKKEKIFLKKLNSPQKIQNYLNKLQFNFEEKGETIQSPVRVLRSKKAHCFEGALLAAYALSLAGRNPLILHLQASRVDFDHVIALFQEGKFWGAISKTNHTVLRYREPIYRNVRELVMSYFHEYFTQDGRKNLRKYSEPFNLSRLNFNWANSEEDLWIIDKTLDKIKHHAIAPNKLFRNMRKADKIERKAGEIEEFKRK